MLIRRCACWRRQRAGALKYLCGVNAEKNAANILISQFKPAGAALHLNVENIPWAGETSYELFVVDAQNELARQKHWERCQRAGWIYGVVKAPRLG